MARLATISIFAARMFHANSSSVWTRNGRGPPSKTNRFPVRAFAERSRGFAASPLVSRPPRPIRLLRRADAGIKKNVRVFIRKWRKRRKIFPVLREENSRLSRTFTTPRATSPLIGAITAVMRLSRLMIAFTRYELTGKLPDDVAVKSARAAVGGYLRNAGARRALRLR